MFVNKWFKKNTNQHNEENNIHVINKTQLIFIIVMSSFFSVLLSIIVFAIFLNSGIKVNKYLKGGNTETNIGQSNDIIIHEDNALKLFDTDSIRKSVVTVDVVSKGGFFSGKSTLCSANGVFINNSGYILTSAYITEYDGDIKVIDYDGTEYEATVESTDKEAYITILKIDVISSRPVVFGDSSQMFVGSSVIGIGNRVTSELSHPILFGTICGYDLDVSTESDKKINVFQADVSAISSSIGGFLFNGQGELIAMTTTEITSQSSEIALAVPINDLKSSVDRIIQNSETPELPKLGISGSDAHYGVIVDNVSKDSLADCAGMKRGDLIIKINETPVHSLAEIRNIKSSLNIGADMQIYVYRNGEIFTFNIKMN